MNCAYLLFLVALTAIAIALKIDNVKVPSEYILDNVENPEILILECEYDLTVDERIFVMKWYFNDQLIYQLIQRSADYRYYVHPLIRSNIDLNYTSPDHRRLSTLAITKPRPNMTGTYTCALGTFEAEDKLSKHLQIIIPETDFQLKVEEATGGSGYINVECLAKDVYPEVNKKSFITCEAYEPMKKN